MMEWCKSSSISQSKSPFSCGRCSLTLFIQEGAITPTTKLAWVYKDDDRVAVKAVYRQDVNKVQPGVFLGKKQFEVFPITIIQQIAHHTPGASDRYIVMDAGFFNALYWTNGNTRKRYYYATVRRWVGNVNLMELDYIFLRTKDNEFHWMLFIINIAARRFECYDSLFNKRRNNYHYQSFNILQRFMSQEQREHYYPVDDWAWSVKLMTSP
jgi:Ulp1 family protease